MVLLAGLCFLAALASGMGRLREHLAFELEATLQAGWFASRTEAHLLRFAAILERFAAHGEPERESFTSRSTCCCSRYGGSCGSRTARG